MPRPTSSAKASPPRLAVGPPSTSRPGSSVASRGSATCATRSARSWNTAARAASAAGSARAVAGSVVPVTSRPWRRASSATARPPTRSWRGAGARIEGGGRGRHGQEADLARAAEAAAVQVARHVERGADAVAEPEQREDVAVDARPLLALGDRGEVHVVLDVHGARELGLEDRSQAPHRPARQRLAEQLAGLARVDVAGDADADRVHDVGVGARCRARLGDRAGHLVDGGPLGGVARAARCAPRAARRRWRRPRSPAARTRRGRVRRRAAGRCGPRTRRRCGPPSPTCARAPRSRRPRAAATSSATRWAWRPRRARRCGCA